MWPFRLQPAVPNPRPPRRQGWRLALPLLPALLVLMVLMSLVWLPWKAQQIESDERQAQLIADTLWVEQSIRLQLAHNEESLRMVAAEIVGNRLAPEDLPGRMAMLLDRSREIARVTWRDADDRIIASAGEPVPEAAEAETVAASSRATVDTVRLTGVPRYSAPTASADPNAPVSMDYHLPLLDGTHYRGRLVAHYTMATVLEEMVPWWFAQDNEVTLVGANDEVVERLVAGGPGRGVYTHAHALDLPGANLTLRTDSLKAAPKLLPNLLVASVIALSLALLGTLVALWRDINRRLDAESALRQQVSFRSAMENSLVTGLRARDLEGRVTYVNPAFCAMVGTQADDLLGRVPPMPYWAPEAMAEYQKRFSEVLAGTITPQGFETIFQRASGKRFPVLIFESPLLDESGRQTGWMGSILDISDRKQIEDLNRQQQEKLEASARLASMGEIASTLAHELNQPLAAISSYTTGALNMLDNSARHGAPGGSGRAGGGLNLDSLRLALEKASTQARRAGQIIRSVHAFVKQRAPAREPVSVRALIDGIVPLIELQAHKYFVILRISVAADLPPVLADRLLIEQVLLNLTRNAIEAMEDVAPMQRILRIHAMQDNGPARPALIDAGAEATGVTHAVDVGAIALAAAPQGALSAAGADAGLAPSVRIAVIDRGHGVAPEIGERLFSPFFSTKAEGMGMGLNICRTTIEFHGGQLQYRANPDGGTIFEFSLPVAVPVTQRAVLESGTRS